MSMAEYQEKEPQDFRNLYEESQSKTLFFTTSKSSSLEQTNGEQSASTGIYQCTLERDDDRDFWSEADLKRESCHVATILADSRNFFSDRKHSEFVLRNIQFDLSSLRSSSNRKANKKANQKKGETKKNFIYANSHIVGGVDWEIVRAELPQQGDFNSKVLNKNGTLQFEYVFRSLEAIGWNECDFDCCIKDDVIDEQWDEDTNTNYEYKHAYLRTNIRSFVVDEHTGDVFVSWEGFYKDCTDVFAASKKLQWTIGISRLKMEDTKCTFLGRSDHTFKSEGQFARCSETVSIVFQSSRGREVVLPYGGFAVIPSSATGNKRIFLLSVLSRPEIDSGDLTSRVWAFPEGGNALRDESKRQDLTDNFTVVDEIFMDANIWDGGSLRLHYNSTSGKPDHLCRTIFGEGIECFQITVGTDTVYSSSDPQSFLSKDQTATFCRLGDADKTRHSELDDWNSNWSHSYNRGKWERLTTLVSGLDVQWNKLSGQPERIYFGCWGGEGGNGNFGSVEKNGMNLLQVIPGAFASSVLFFPSELEGTIDPRDPSINKSSVSSSFLKIMAVALTLVVAAMYRRKRRPSSRFASLNAAEKEFDCQVTYVELQNIDDSSKVLATP